MPSINQQIVEHGPLIEVYVGVSTPHRDALVKAQAPVPPAILCRLLVDTGASCTCVDPDITKQLNLSPRGSVSVHTPSTGAGNTHTCAQYDVSLMLVHSSFRRVFTAIPVLASSLSHQGIDGLLGRDVLSKCLLVYNGELQFFTLAI